ncbi:MAG TPA: dihydrofolate reductase family protein [Candidatus Polarisedimenticolaceae bacterium]|nr:dihydrofolate reductase family protein [Candidatus Polarisedimenticolaceae bacterium]
MNRPFVYVNMAMSADGKITSKLREEPRFTSPRDKKTMDKLRAEADALLIGAGTLRHDDPRQDVRDPEMKAYRRSLDKPDLLLNVLVTASADVDPQSKLFDPAKSEACVVATVEDAPEERLRRLREVAEIWTLGRGRVDIPLLLARLKARGVERLLVEGGGDMNWSFVENDAIDELYVTVAPAIFGGRDAPTPVEGEGLTMASRRKLRLVSAEIVEGEIFCRYAFVR